MSAQSAMSHVEVIEGTLDDFDLHLDEYPDGSLTFSGLDKNISNDGTSIRIAPLAALQSEVKGTKKAKEIIYDAGMELFPNADAYAFPPEIRPQFIVSVKLELAGITHRREAIVISHYFIAAAASAVGPLCYLIAKEYEEFLEYAKRRDDIMFFVTPRVLSIRDAHLCAVVPTDDKWEKLSVWKACIRHDD